MTNSAKVLDYNPGTGAVVLELEDGTTVDSSVSVFFGGKSKIYPHVGDSVTVTLNDQGKVLYFHQPPIEVQRTVSISLNDYQRANLWWLLEAVHKTDVFQLADTGDWVGEIQSMLEVNPPTCEPNMTLEELKEKVDAWLAEIS